MINSTFQADVVGGPGSRCPGLVPNEVFLRYNASIFFNLNENHDGVLVLRFYSTGKVVHNSFNRLLLTDSGHYLLPSRGPPAESDTKDCIRLVKQYQKSLFKTNGQINKTTLHETIAKTETPENDLPNPGKPLKVVPKAVSSEDSSIQLSRGIFTPAGLVASTSPGESLLSTAAVAPGPTSIEISTPAVSIPASVASFYKAWNSIDGVFYSGDIFPAALMQKLGAICLSSTVQCRNPFTNTSR